MWRRSCIIPHKQDSTNHSKSDTRASESIKEVDLANWPAVAELLVNRICRNHGESARQNLQEVLSMVPMLQADDVPMMWESSQFAECEDSRYVEATSIEARISRDGTKVILAQRQRQVTREYTPKQQVSGSSRNPEGAHTTMENNATPASAISEQASMQAVGKPGAQRAERSTRHSQSHPPPRGERRPGPYEEATGGSRAGFYSTVAQTASQGVHMQVAQTGSQGMSSTQAAQMASQGVCKPMHPHGVYSSSLRAEKEHGTQRVEPPHGHPPPGAQGPHGSRQRAGSSTPLRTCGVARAR